MTKTNQTRSTTPKFSVAEAGIVASSVCALVIAGGYSANEEEYSVPEVNAGIEANDISDSIQIQIREEWDKERHAPELNKLIVKKATSESGLGKSENLRLEQLQRMRRESLPLPLSYEEFIKSRDRESDLDNLIDMLADFRRKYVTNG